MKRYFGLLTLLVVLALGSTGFAKDTEQKCWIGNISTVEHRDGVTVRTVSFLDQTPPDPEANTAGLKKKEKVNAHVYIPDSANPVPAILFSHSATHNYQGTTSLLPFAMALARAGAASIVLDRAIQWEPYDEAANRDISVMDCASKWFLSEVHVDLSRIATAGNYHCPQSVVDLSRHGCLYAVGYGFISPAEQLNTEYLMSVKGQLKLAWGLERQLKLPAMNPDWLKVETKSDDAQMASASN